MAVKNDLDLFYFDETSYNGFCSRNSLGEISVFF